MVNGVVGAGFTSPPQDALVERTQYQPHYNFSYSLFCTLVAVKELTYAACRL
jgi:hypothetical protein